jgi:phosphohistidine phosphatase SixA
MIVGHNPMVEALAHHLVRESRVTAAAAMGYPTAGLLSIAFPTPMPHKLLHAGEALQLITPSLT